MIIYTSLWYIFFFFSSRRRHTRCGRDWSSDVCFSDLVKSLEEKLVQFIELDNKTRELMGRNSRKKVEKEFDRNIVINEYMKAINNILKEGYQNESI